MADRRMSLASVLILGGTVTFSAAVQHDPQGTVPAVRGLERFQAWSRQVWAHVPGQWDEPAWTIAGWPMDDLNATRSALQALVTLVNGHGGPSTSVRYTDGGDIIRPTNMRPTSASHSMKMSDVPALLGLSTERFSDAEITTFMKRAAMLHTDIVVLGSASTGSSVRARQSATRSSGVRVVVDGQDVGVDAAPVHWEFGRTALDGIQPRPADDMLAARWYRATSEYQAARGEYGYLAPHLESGRKIFPADPAIQFYAGVLHEALASPAVQVAVNWLWSREGFQPAVASVPKELREAETFLRHALDLDPAQATARLHLGRVMGLLDRHDEAVAQLRSALALLTDERQRYYAELFLGGEEQARGQPDEAQAAFTRASALFPRAQSPHLALSHLAWQAADRDGALAAFRGLVALPVDAADREDPWWTYRSSAFLHAGDLIKELWQIAARDLR